MRRTLLFSVGVALAAMAGQPAYATVNLVTNSNFGTGTFSGWSASDGSISIDSSLAPPSDSFDAQFGGNGLLSQVLTTISGQPYTLSFSLLDESGLNGDHFIVDFGGFSTTITGDTAASTYTPEVFSIPGADITSARTTLSFQAINPFSAWNLDDVSVTQNAIPEAPAGAILTGAVLLILSLRLRGRMGISR
jgi:hypothetical protein